MLNKTENYWQLSNEYHKLGKETSEAWLKVIYEAFSDDKEANEVLKTRAEKLSEELNQLGIELEKERSKIPQ